MTLHNSKLMVNTTPQRSSISKVVLFAKKTVQGLLVLGEGFYLIFSKKMYRHPNNPDNTQYVQYFCQRLGEVFNVKVQVHGEVPRFTALWVSNHISWLDIAVLGAGARVFFLAKAEVKSWPILGQLAAWGGTLFIKRGSGDSGRMREQIATFLKQDIPVLFFPEATTGDGTYIKKVHGRLLLAAIEAEKPVQICIISYVNKKGQLDSIVPFVGEQTLLHNVLNVLQMEEVVAHLVALPAIESSGHTLASLTDEVQRQMNQGLQKLHQSLAL